MFQTKSLIHTSTIFQSFPFTVRQWAKVLVAVAMMGISVPGTTIAQQPTVPKVDAPPVPKPLPTTEYPSFEVQGEYQGWMLINGQKKDYALQVVGTGKNSVRAVLLIGKLPGLGTYEFQSAHLKGQGDSNPANNFRLESKNGIKLTYDQAKRRFLQYDLNQEVIGQFDRIDRESETAGLPPEENAKILFDEAAHELKNASVDEDGLLNIGSITEFNVGGFRLHMEFKIPYQPEKSQQGRGNSGVYIQRRYEVQILDSFGEQNRFNYCGSLYRQRPPALLMSYPPEQWQTYDIWFTPAKWNGKQKSANARLTVKQNGVTIHDDIEILNKTGNGQKEGPELRPILFQNHGDPVKFRNIWITTSN